MVLIIILALHKEQLSLLVEWVDRLLVLVQHISAKIVGYSVKIIAQATDFVWEVSAIVNKDILGNLVIKSYAQISNFTIKILIIVFLIVLMDFITIYLTEIAISVVVTALNGSNTPTFC